MDKFTNDQLKNYLRKIGKKVSGPKADLVARIKFHIYTHGLDEQEILNEIGNDQKDQEEISSSDSASQVSGRASTVSSVGSMKMAAAARKAAAKAKLEKLKQVEKVSQEQMELERERERLSMKRERLTLEAEMEAADAETKICEEFENGNENENSIVNSDMKKRFHKLRFANEDSNVENHLLNKSEPEPKPNLNLKLNLNCRMM